MSRRLQETLGVDAGNELVTWMSNVDDLRGDVAELRHEMDNRFISLEGRTEKGFARLETLIESRSANLIKWSFVFWVSAVGAIAALAGLLK